MLTFNADEILAIAEKIEKKGAEFYRQAAKNFSDAEDKETLLFLADMEDSHEETFAEMRKDLKKTGILDPDDQAAAFLQAMTGGLAADFEADPAEKLSGRETMADIFQIAIGLEKDSIILYLGIKEAMADDAGKSAVDKIIREEMGHITVLTKGLAYLKERQV